jgi:hypothetical protein
MVVGGCQRKKFYYNFDTRLARGLSTSSEIPYNLKRFFSFFFSGHIADSLKVQLVGSRKVSQAKGRHSEYLGLFHL